jgi:hypothetical protein
MLTKHRAWTSFMSPSPANLHQQTTTTPLQTSTSSDTLFTVRDLEHPKQWSLQPRALFQGPNPAKASPARGSPLVSSPNPATEFFELHHQVYYEQQELRISKSQDMVLLDRSASY